MTPNVRVQNSVARGRPIHILVGDERIDCFEGESVAAALWAAGIRYLRSSPVLAAPRGMFCNMGVCQECVVRIEGRLETSCSYPARDGLQIELLRTR